MGDLAQLTQSVILGLIVSYLLAKLISIVVTFKEDDLFLTHHHDPEPESEIKPVVDSRRHRVESSTVGGEAEQGSSRGEEEDDDWEGVESTELDKAFSAATLFATTAASDRLMSRKVPSDVQKQLYGLYKIATEGACTAPKPSALKLTARAKWQAWKKLGAMPPEEAMEKYIEIVTQHYPTWLNGGLKAGIHDAVSNSREAMGPVSSSMVYEDESQNDIAKILVDKNADVNAKDNEGQTPLLHYAVECDREAFAEVLVKQKGNAASTGPGSEILTD